MATFLPLLILLLVIAALLRDDFSLTVVYLFLAVSLIGAWWGRRALTQVTHTRRFNSHAFPGEPIEIKLHLHNRGFLPVVWLSIHDSLPVALSTHPFFQQVLSLGPGGKTDYSYTIHAKKRGYYPIGPLQISGGDLLGLNKPLHIEKQSEYITVYPKVIPLSSVWLPSRSPQGTLRHNQQIFEDPSRLFGKREYTPGDSLRRVDWKSSASSGRLQVKIFEPSIALETVIFLDLDSDHYHYRHPSESTELAIVIAASLAAWISGKQQTVGLKINGRDPFAESGIPQYLPPRKGQANLMRILETLARINPVSGPALADVVRQQRHQLSWGATLIVITGQADTPLLDELHQARRAGQNVTLVLAGRVTKTDKDTHERADHFGIPIVAINSERDMDIWRQ